MIKSKCQIVSSNCLFKRGYAPAITKKTIEYVKTISINLPKSKEVPLIASDMHCISEIAKTSKHNVFLLFSDRVNYSFIILHLSCVSITVYKNVPPKTMIISIPVAVLAYSMSLLAEIRTASSNINVSVMVSIDKKINF